MASPARPIAVQIKQDHDRLMTRPWLLSGQARPRALRAAECAAGCAADLPVRAATRKVRSALAEYATRLLRHPASR
jgi:hypothetical protein